MPWHIGAKGSHGCSGYPVIKDSDDSVAGCHTTKAKAQAQLAALYANEKSGKLPGMSKIRLGVPERRLAKVGMVRAVEDGGQQGRFVARVLTYNALDDYRTQFAPGVFNESMDRNMPKITWGHDWQDPLGRWVSYEETDAKYLDLLGEFDDFEAVPRARQAYAQLQSGTISQFSVGFMPQEYARDEETDVITFTRGRLDEVALVIVGAVPGTELLALRHRPRITLLRQQVLTQEDATAILVKLSQGEMDLTDALVAVKERAVTAEELEATEGDEDDEGSEHSQGAGDGQPEGTETPPEGTGDDEPDDGDDDEGDDEGNGEEDAELQAEIDAALATVAAAT
jgi:HK97 family phage prohead protease